MGKITKFSSETVKSIVRLPVFSEIRKKLYSQGRYSIIGSKRAEKRYGNGKKNRNWAPEF